MSSLSDLTDGIRRVAATQAARRHRRITWIDGVPHIQECPEKVDLGGGRSRSATYDRDGVIVRAATAADLAAMYAGGIDGDPATEPSRLAWEAHVRAGGD